MSIEPTSSRQEGLLRRLRIASRVIAGIVVATGVAVFLGWVVKNEWLKGDLHGGLTTKTNAAITLCLLGTSLWLLVGEKPSRRAAFVGRVAAVLGVSIALLTLIEHLMGLNLGIDQLLFEERPGAPATASPNRMGPPACICFTLVGIALLLLPIKGREKTRDRADLVSGLGLLTGLIAMIPTLGHLFGANELYSNGHVGIALPTAIMIIALSLGILLATPRSRFVVLITSDDAGGMLARRLLPPAILLPPLLGYLRTVGEHAHWFDAAFGRALMVISLIVIFVLVIWAAALKLESFDKARRAADRAQLASEDALRQSEAQFRMLADTIPQLAWMTGPDGSISWYNQRWHDYCGSTHEQMVGWGWSRVHDPKLLPAITERWKQAILKGDPWEDTFPLRRHDGEMRWHLSRAMPLRNSDGEIVSWFGTNTDITESRNIEETLRHNEERYRHLAERESQARAEAERVSQVKDEFLATLSHELRTPLTAMLGWAQILRQPGVQAEDLKEGLAVIERNARVQGQLVEDLLDMSRIISGKLRIDVQAVAMADIISAAVESVRPAADARDIRLQKVLDSTIEPVRGDSARLQQVVWNLLSNAVKFTPRGGTVQVSLQRVNSHVELTVSDNGSGIKPEFLPFVFERFRQADSSTTRRHAGLGLGLAIVKSLVELHGGNVRAKSAGEGQGSAFIVELPVAVVRDTPAAAEVRPPLAFNTEPDEICTPGALRGISVLVVDDEPDARNLIAHVLSNCAADVQTASSAAEALAILRHSRPTVVLSDIGMAGQDGYDFIRQVRQLSSSEGGATPAAALTAFARSEDRTRALRAGYQSHISKPVEPAELIAVVISLAARRQSKTHSDTSEAAR